MLRITHVKLEMPSWSTGVKRRLRTIPAGEIRDAVVALFILFVLAVGMISPLILAFLTPPMVD
ncbi:MAG: hypothetical protein JW730_06990 [Anaerolineales bacterium]|nr:hypothetical protein [Anaerolineales bacterium]